MYCKSFCVIINTISQVLRTERDNTEIQATLKQDRIV